MTETASSAARIVFIEDHQILVDGLGNLLKTDVDFALQCSYRSGEEFIQQYKAGDADIAVVDVNLPGMNGIEITNYIQENFTDLKVLGLSMHAQVEYVKRMFQAGAQGYLLKECAGDELLLALKKIQQGESYISSKLSDRMLGLKNQNRRGGGGLTDREREVVTYLSDGKSCRQIGEILNISTKTVDVHRRNILQKLNINSMAELTKYAIKEGLTDYPI